jgi:tetratricopeptide (TPR) repeat protein
MDRSTALRLLVASSLALFLLAPALAPVPAGAWEVRAIEFGLDFDRRTGQLKTIKNVFATTEPWPLQLVRFARPPWPTTIASQASGPAGSRPLNREYRLRWDPTWTSAWFLFTFPTLGVDLEDWVGTWTARVLVEGKEVGAPTFTLTRGDAAEAIARFEKDVAANPEAFWPHYYLGAVLAQAGKTDAAVQHLQKASSINRRSFYPWYTLGRMYQRLGRKEEARNAYAMVKGLLMGYEDPSLSKIFAEWAELHLRELD